MIPSSKKSKRSTERRTLPLRPREIWRLPPPGVFQSFVAIISCEGDSWPLAKVIMAHGAKFMCLACIRCVLLKYIYIYIYIYTKIILWCEDEERSIPLQVEGKVKVNTQGKDQLLLLRVSCRLAIFRQLTYQIYYFQRYRLKPSNRIWRIAPLINTGLLADFRVNSVQDGFADFTNVAFSWVYEAAFSVVFEVWFVIF